MGYRMLALDLDGTLTNEKKEITPRTRRALEDATARGVKVVLATGRPAIGVWPVAREIGLDKIGGYLLPYNGAVAIDCLTGKELFADKLPVSVLRDICRLARAFDVVPLNYDETSVITEQPEHPSVKQEAYNNGLPIKKVESLLDAVTEDKPKYMVVGDPVRLAAFGRAVLELFGDGCSVLQPQPDFLDVEYPGVEKPSAIHRLAGLFGISREEVMACGDGLNDISMLRYAGLGVAMANSYPEVLQVADYVTLSNDEDGVAAAVEKFILND